MDSRRRPVQTADAEQLRSVGQAIRETRQGRYTLKMLAAKAQISLGVLSQIENGRGNPTVNMLMRISSALNVEVVDLLETRPPSVTYVVRADDRRVLSSHRRSGFIQLLSPSIRHEFTVAYSEIQVGESLESDQFRGEQIFYVLAGDLTVHTTESTFLLGDQDSLVIRTTPQQRLTNAGSRIVQMITVFKPDDD